MAQMRDMTEPLDQYDDQSDYDWDYDPDDDRSPRPKVLWGRVISLVVFVLIAFLLGRMSKGGPSEDEFKARGDQITDLQAQVDQLDRELTIAENENDADAGTATEGDGGDDPEPQETSDPPEQLQLETYTVQPGDTLSGIVKREYTCTEAVSTTDPEDTSDLTAAVEDANLQQDPTFDAALLAAGQEILLPPIPPGYECA